MLPYLFSPSISVVSTRTAHQHTRGSDTDPRNEAPVLRPAGNNKLPRAGRLQLQYTNWVCITSNSFVLSIIKNGLMLKFHTPPPIFTLSSPPFSPSRSLSISSEVYTLHDKTAIAVIEPMDNQICSPIFDVPKRDSPSSRVILNLKTLNQYIYKTSFKLEGIQVIQNMIRHGDYLVSIDLRDAFLMLSMFPEFFRFLCFDWEDIRYCFTTMPFGLCCAPRIFTKVMLAVLKFLRQRGLRVSAWFDDIIIAAESVSLLLEHLHFAKLILKSLGFLINDSKSSFIPSQTMLHLGFIWNTVPPTLSIPVGKVTDLKLMCEKALLSPVTLRFLQKILGTIESLRVAFPYAALHYRKLQHEVSSLISKGENWNKKIAPNTASQTDLKWWINCPSDLPPKSLAPFSHDLSVTTDSSSYGWGCFSSLNTEASGFWSEEEQELHINILEMKAILFSFLSLFKDFSNVSILIKSDNTTAIAYINHYGGVRSQAITNLVIQLYEFCMERGISIKASFLAGRLNTRADALSRRTRDHCYSIPQSLFSHLTSHFNIKPFLDAFASRTNSKLDCYFSYGPDPHAVAQDAFSQKLPSCFYAFPPIVLVDKFLSYFMTFADIEALIIVPFWPSKTYFPTLLSILTDDPLYFSAAMLQGRPAPPKLLSTILACPISTNHGKIKDYHRRLLHRYSDQSTSPLWGRMCVTSVSISIGSIGKMSVWAHPACH